MDPRGYSWWYVDALSDDGVHGLTIIGLIGSVFSPYYAWSGWRRPENHCAMNVALYGPNGRWAMTERGERHLSRDANTLAIGPSTMRWERDGLTVELDEVCSPLPRRIRGRIRLEPEWINENGFAINRGHRWWPLAPKSRVAVELDEPNMRWEGHGYLDSNWGPEPLEEGFHGWNWSRTNDRSVTFINYDTHCPGGNERYLALRFDERGELRRFEPPPMRRLPETGWRVPRHARGDEPKVVETLEDTPFYSRSVLETEIEGRRVLGVHESLSLERFTSPVVRLMLPFRMPRVAGFGLARMLGRGA